jgi:hypothetical protein
MLADARTARPAFLYDPRREMETYRQILTPADMGTATFHGAICDGSNYRYWLLIERVVGCELYTIGSVAIWQLVACWLARLHCRHLGQHEGLAQRVPLLRHDGDFYRFWLPRALQFSANSSSASLDRLRRGYEQVVERLLALPTTFIHGDFYASNILIQETGHSVRVCPIDWEMAALGPGLVDLAALIAGKWTAEEQEMFAASYHAALPPDKPSSRETFLKELDCCRLYLAVKWLGWSATWTPPAAQAHDWLGEALMLVDKLNL